MEAHHINPGERHGRLRHGRAALQPALVGNGNGTARAAERNPSDPTSWGKVGRNEACPCGSGKKYKHCHGRFA